MSTIAVNAITNAAGGNTATINGMTPTADSLQGFRNRLINSDMRIDQRNAGASVTPAIGTVAYTLDRWAFYGTQASKLTTQQNAGSVTPPIGFTNYLGITSSSAYSVLTSDAFLFEQKIEGFNTADLGWGTANAQSITLSFWARSSLTGSFSGSVSNNALDRSYVFTYSIAAANTWEYKTITIPGETSGTWLTTNGTGIWLRFNLGAGSTFATTAGSWAVGNFISATGAVSVVGTSGATFYITGVQLEAGSVATPFERRPYGTELALCQRYYELSAARLDYQMSTSGIYGMPFFFKATKRATPTITFGTVYAGSPAAGTVGLDYFSISTPAAPTHIAFGNLQVSAEL